MYERRAHSSVIGNTYAIINTTGADGCCAASYAGTAALRAAPTAAASTDDGGGRVIGTCPTRPHLKRDIYGPSGSDCRSTCCVPDPDPTCALRAARAAASTDRGRVIGTNTACAGRRAPCTPDSRTAGRDSRSPAAAERVAGGSQDVGG